MGQVITLHSRDQSLSHAEKIASLTYEATALEVLKIALSEAKCLEASWQATVLIERFLNAIDVGQPGSPAEIERRQLKEQINQARRRILGEAARISALAREASATSIDRPYANSHRHG